MSINTIKICRAKIAPIRTGLTPTGDIFAESSEPDETNAKITGTKVEIRKNLIVICCLLFASIFCLFIKVIFIQA
jgi:hypothetical protein